MAIVVGAMMVAHVITLPLVDALDSAPHVDSPPSPRVRGVGPSQILPLG